MRIYAVQCVMRHSRSSLEKFLVPSRMLYDPWMAKKCPPRLNGIVLIIAIVVIATRISVMNVLLIHITMASIAYPTKHTNPAGTVDFATFSSNRILTSSLVLYDSDRLFWYWASGHLHHRKSAPAPNVSARAQNPARKNYLAATVAVECFANVFARCLVYVVLMKAVVSPGLKVIISVASFV